MLSCKEMKHMFLAPLHIAAKHAGTQRTRTQLGGTSWGGSPWSRSPMLLGGTWTTTLPAHRPNQGSSQESRMWVRSTNAATAEWDLVRSPASQSPALSPPHGGWENQSLWV